MAVGRRLLHKAVRAASLLAFHYPKVLAAHLNRRNLTYSKTVLSELGGTANHETGRYAVFVMWQKSETPWYVWNALAALNAASANVVLVVNHALPDDRIAELLPHVSTILIRNNAGMDIGGYKDATEYITRTYKPDRVAYLNDSVYYFRNGLQKLIDRLFESDADVAAAFENWEFGYHLQSFCVSFSGRIVASEPFQNFWRDYIPVGSRVWAINRGERMMTQSILPVAHRVEVIFSLAELAQLLEKQGEDARTCREYLPLSVRPTSPEMRGLRASEIADLITGRAAIRSTIHTAGFLFTKYMANPLMKRDLVYRLQFDAREVERLMKKAGITEELVYIATELRKKGSGMHLKLIDFIKFASGVK